MRALCVARHPFIAEHLAAWFGALGLDCACTVGFADALTAAGSHRPDLVICEYDLLATTSLAAWERDPVLGSTPVIAVSLTRRPDEMHLLDRNGIAGFLYLPAITRADARRLVAALERPVRAPAAYSLPSSLEWTRPTTTAR